MRATVRVVNPKRGIYAAEFNDSAGEFVIFKLLDTDEPQIGDVVSHSDFYSMGGETYRNVTQGCSIEVFVQNVCGANLVRQQCML